MKHVINLSVIFLLLSVLTTITFAQEVKTETKNMVKTKLMDGTNSQGPNWIDVDGDGICDNNGLGNSGKKNKGTNKKGGNKKRNGGFGDGTGVGPQDGSGFGLGNGSGNCDGTGSKGGNKRKGKN